ncbi:Ribonuclease H-like superfamily [Sesbania bispinosa]|nr:Ribonuclease H-like superfamily [Sesbania bispinosa]
MRLKINWDIWFGVFLGLLWDARNCKVFKAEEVNIQALLWKIKHYVDSVQASWTFETATNPKESLNSCKMVSWSPPSFGFIKINCDGSVRPPNQSGACGAVFRDHSRAFKGAFSCNIGPCSILMAELWAISHAIKLASAKGYQRIWIESDSKISIEFINNGVFPCHQCSSIIKDITAGAGSFEEIRWFMFFVRLTIVQIYWLIMVTP